MTGDHDHGYILIQFPDAHQYIQATHAGQNQIHGYEVIGFGGDHLQAVLSGSGIIQEELIMPSKAHLDQLGMLRIVLNDQNAKWLWHEKHSLWLI